MKTSYVNPSVQFVLLCSTDVLSTSGEQVENWTKFYSIDDLKDDIF